MCIFKGFLYCLLDRQSEDADVLDYTNQRGVSFRYSLLKVLVPFTTLRSLQTYICLMRTLFIISMLISQRAKIKC